MEIVGIAKAAFVVVMSCLIMFFVFHPMVPTQRKRKVLSRMRIPSPRPADIRATMTRKLERWADLPHLMDGEKYTAFDLVAFLMSEQLCAQWPNQQFEITVFRNEFSLKFWLEVKTQVNGKPFAVEQILSHDGFLRHGELKLTDENFTRLMLAIG